LTIKDSLFPEKPQVRREETNTMINEASRDHFGGPATSVVKIGVGKNTLFHF
jgi:hypothetical protein